MSVRVSRLVAEVLRSGARCWAGLLERVRRRPDAFAVGIIVLVAAGPRLALLSRAPLFVRQDSLAYFEAGFALARGVGVDDESGRTPGYPLFLAGTIRLLGDDLLGIALAQHVLGVLTALLTYLVGRGLFGRAAGLLAGLLVAVSGPLLIHEHSLMSETVFGFLLVLATWLLTRGLGGSGRSTVAAGVVLGLAFLTRPIGVVVLPALWLAILLGPGARRARLAGIGLLTLGFASLVAPVSLADAARGGEGRGASLGPFLYDRVARHDTPPFVPRASSPAPTDDPRQVAARRQLLKLVADKASRNGVDYELRRKLGLSEAEANRAMRDVALEVIAGQPGWYAERTLLNVRAILLGEPESLRFHWAGRDRRDVREPWLAHPAIAHLLTPTSAAQGREQPIAEALVGLFQPAQHRLALGMAIALGLSWGAIRPGSRPSLALAAAAAALIVAGAALIGDVPRYRYPADPLLAVLAGGGLAACLHFGAAIVARLRRGRVRQRENSRGAELAADAQKPAGAVAR